MRRIKTLLMVMLVLVSFFNGVSAQESAGCCEETINGDFCVNVPGSQCKSGKDHDLYCSRLNLPQCKTGTCIDLENGECSFEVTRSQCSGGEFFENSRPSKCELGGCVLGGGCNLISKSECEVESVGLGLRSVNFDPNVGSSLECIEKHILTRDVGCCAPPIDGSGSCFTTTRGECRTGNSFFERQTCTLLPNRCPECQETQLGCTEFGDWVIETNSCDESIRKIKHCDLTQSQKCGQKSNGDYDCIDVSCNVGDEFIIEEYNLYADEVGYETYKVANSTVLGGKNRQNGESWCIYSDKNGNYRDVRLWDTRDVVQVSSAGSRYSKYSCVDGKIKVDPCGVFRDSVCVSNSGIFENAKCVENKWRDCMAAKNSDSKCNAPALAGMCYWDTHRRNECWPVYPPGYSDFYETSMSSPNAFACEPTCGQGKADKCDKNECPHLGDCAHSEGWWKWYSGAFVGGVVGGLAGWGAGAMWGGSAAATAPEGAVVIGENTIVGGEVISGPLTGMKLMGTGASTLGGTASAGSTFYVPAATGGGMFSAGNVYTGLSATSLGLTLMDQTGVVDLSRPQDQSGFNIRNQNSEIVGGVIVPDGGTTTLQARRIQGDNNRVFVPVQPGVSNAGTLYIGGDHATYRDQ
tara:strand:- start:629 stop:2533 length:1905 start_codon:yes stop_codon:yes gene_type:complete